MSERKEKSPASPPASPRFAESRRARCESQGGQILLIVILVIIIASTIGLTLASRSITSLRTSTEEAESQKALAAAEAGIERAIQGSVPIAVQGNNPSNNSSYATQFTQIQSSSFLINGGNAVPKDEGADVWFVNHNADGTPDYSSALSPNFLHLYWGTPQEACGTSTAPAAIQAIVILRNKNTGEIKSYRYAYDSCPARISVNNFTQADSGSFTVTGISNFTFGNRTPETGANSDLAKGVNDIVFMRVIPIYKDAVVGVYACNHAGNNCTSLPSQGYMITSTGTSGSSTIKIVAFEGYSQTYLPYLSYGLFVAN
ncbi:MAG: hypothetical protein HYW62_01445 [Candidatus Levybacteria bacterium]|nr:hypothetical protein [Candidatus Levybacteria bacterium]